MKRLLTICIMIVALATTMKAQSVPAVVVSTAEGDSAIAISNILGIYHLSGNLTIFQRGDNTSVFALADIVDWHFGTTGSSGDTIYSIYDVNHDGQVNSADVVSIYNYINVGEESGITLERADVNDDEAVNSADVTAIYTYIAGNETEVSQSGAYPSADAIEAMYMKMQSGQVNVVSLDSLGLITFNAAGDTLYIIYNDRSNSVATADVSSFYYGGGVETVEITYSADSAAIVNPLYFSGVQLSASGAGVTANSTYGDEVEYTLSGESGNGFFKLYSDKRYQLTLKGLTLTNPNGPVINSQTGKRGEIKSQKGYVNTLTDGTSYTASGTEDQKGCIFSEGQLIFKGAGALTVNGNYKHGICSDDYIIVENSDITVNAKGDALHANDSVSLQGGTLTLHPQSDGIDCEGPVTIAMAGADGTTDLAIMLDSADCAAIKSDTLITALSGNIVINTTGAADKALKSKGDIIVGGGSIEITQSGSKIVEDGDASYSSAFKATRNVAVTAGTVSITNTADGGKGISSDGEVNILGGNITINANGAGGTLENSSSSGGGGDSEKSYKVYVSLPQNGGRGGGFGPGGQSNNGAWSNVYLYKSDGTLVQQLTSTVSLTPATGSGSTTFYYYDFKASDSGTYYFKSDDYTSRGGGWGGSSATTYTIQSSTFSGPTSGTDIYYSISNSYTTASTTRTYSLTNVSSSYSGSSSGSAEENGTAYSATGIKSDSIVNISGGTLTIYNKGAMSKSIKADHSLTLSGGMLNLYPSGTMEIVSGDATYSTAIKTDYFIGNGGNLNITASGTANRGISADKDLTVNDGTYVITNSSGGYSGSSDSYTAKGITCDQNVSLLGGDITVNMSGNGGKGIKVGGALVVGKSDTDGPVLNVTTTGSSFGSSSSSGGGWGWGGFGQQSSGGSAKAIKVMGAATVNGGQMTVSTAQNKAEGLESKTSVTINGGRHYLKCYDDCINSNGNIYFLGGITVCYSTGNDAVDSNAGTAGAITIGDGTVFAYTTIGDPQEGLDCDNNSYIRITGKGIAISAGGSQGGGGGWGGGSSSSTISNAQQGYYFNTSTVSYSAGRYYTLADASGNNLVTFSFPQALSSKLSLFTATGMVSGSTYTLKYSTTAPTDATTEFQGLYLGSTAVGTTSVTSFTAQ